MKNLSDILNTIHAAETEYPFRAVKCKENDLSSRDPINGFVYFTTDTKKIYCGLQDKYLLMSGSSGIYYGQRFFDDSETDTEEILFIFNKNEIEGTDIPSPDDLIFNIPDGGFYRVRIVNNDNITAERLLVAGGGTTGPGSGGGMGRLAITDNYRGDRYFSISNPEEMKIDFYCTAQITENNYVDEIHYTIGTETFIQKGPYNFKDTIIIDLSKHIEKFSTSTKNTISVIAYDAYGNYSLKKLFSFYVIELTLSSDANKIFKINANNNEVIDYSCKPKGGSSLETKYIELTLASIEQPNNILWSKMETVKNVNINYPFSINLDGIQNIEHGVYILNACFYGSIPSSNGKLLSSNKVSSQIIYYDTAVGTPLFASSFTNITIPQYSKHIMYFMVTDESINTEEIVTMYVGNTATDLSVILNQLNYWDYTFLDAGVFDIIIEYNNIKQKLGTVTVEMYAGEIPIIDKNNAELYLSALGRSNDRLDKDKWNWTDKHNNTYEAKFENFLWGTENGWLPDKNNEMALKLSNGAKLSIPNYHPFAKEATLSGLTIELDFMFSGVLDYSKPLIQCLSSYVIDGETTIQTGFHITGQKATLNSSIHKATIQAISGEADDNGNINETDMALQAFTQYFNENTRIHLTYAIQRIPDWTQIPNDTFYFVYTYLNGVLSGIMKMKVDTANKTSESFKDAAGYPSIISIDSTYGDIYLYNIRVYRNELDMRTIINNYIADNSDIDKKMALFQDNNIFDDSGYISLNAIQDISYALGVPYVLLKGGCLMYEDEELDDYLVNFEPEYRLPLTKTDNRLMAMQMYMPDEKTGLGKLAMDIPINATPLEGGNKITDFTQMENGTTYIPSRGVRVYGQGTSSMVYPVKNLRLRFIQQSDYPSVYEGSCPVKIVCFKADFMDSSSSHNTCTGNLVYDLYAGLGLRTPAQRFKNENKGTQGVITYDILTAIKGFPIIVFYATGNEDAPYTYIGRYNFNIDKATPEPFGFKPQWFYTGKTTIDITGKTRNEVKAVGLKTEIVNGMTVLPIDAEGKDIVRDIVQCWEVLNNDNKSPTKFLTPTGFNTFYEAITKDNNWVEYFEDRYPDKIVDIAKDGKWEDNPCAKEDLENGLFRVAMWLNSTAIDEATNSSLPMPVYYQTLDSLYDKTKTYYTAAGLPIEIVAIDKAAASTGGTGDLQLSGLHVTVETFATQIKASGHSYGEYTFTYFEDGWYLGIEPLGITDLSAYGITYNGAPNNGNSITVRYYQETNWTKELYEKHTVDTAQYRLSKFQAEFTDYFDMNFSLFYYVITLILLMMDSRAKNMMLASWDQTKWYPIFYDMDTMLGINNTGFNKFSFDTEDNSEDKVFNGWDSVLWNNFKVCFPDEIAEFYVRLREDGGLTLNKLLSTYNEKGADAWNEALSSADAYYKYERPYEEGYFDGKDGAFITPGKISYLYAAQGKRSNHRAWWLSNRLNYLDSKFWPMIYGDQKPSQSNTFSFRAYALPEQKSTTNAQACVAAIPANHTFNLTALNNSYQSLLIGNIVYGPVFTSAGQTITLGSADVKHEVESYILNPALIADLGDLSDKYIGSLNFPGQVTRLTRLKLGRSLYANKTEKDILENANATVYYNNLLSAINLGDACPYLNEINVARCTGLKSLDLTQCSRLQTIYADGCTLTDISFPTDSILKEVYLPNSLTSLVITNQPHLTTLNIEGVSKIMDIFLDRVSKVDTYSLVKNIFSDNVTKNFYLTDINWTISEHQKGQDASGALKSIDILETLLSDKAIARSGYTKAQSLSGTITIDIVNCSVDEYEIYSKYHSVFPNLDIIYNEDKVAVTKAIHIKFMTDIDSDQVHYEFYTHPKNENNLSYLISASGPNGQAMSNPSKISSVAFDYKFTGHWSDTNGVWYYDNSATEIKEGAVSFSEIIPTTNLIFYPDFKPVDRYYEVKFYDYDGTVIQQNGEDSYSVQYKKAYDGPIKNFHYRDSSSLELHQRWAFQGWTTSNYGDIIITNPSYVDVTNLEVTGHLNLYAHYKQENVYEVPTNLEYFNIIETEGQQIISLKETYKEILQGKITLPSMANNKPINIIGNFTKTPYITHIFVLQDNDSYHTINPRAFARCDNLQYVDLPKSLNTIGRAAFARCLNLQTIKMYDKLTTISDFAFSGADRDEDTGLTDAKDMQLKLSNLPDSIQIIGGHAFYKGGEFITITKLPSNLQSLYSNAFHSCPNVIITELGSNNENVPILHLKEQALCDAGKNISDRTINIWKSVGSIGKNAFQNYGKNTLYNFYNTLDDTNGIDINNNPLIQEVVYYTSSEQTITELSSPDGSGSVKEGVTLVSMGCPSGSWKYNNEAQQIYVEDIE